MPEKININRAEVEDIQTGLDLDPVVAHKIIALRSVRGSMGISRLEDLTDNIPEVSEPGVVDRIRERTSFSVEEEEVPTGVRVIAVSSSDLPAYFFQSHLNRQIDAAAFDFPPVNRVLERCKRRLANNPRGSSTVRQIGDSINVSNGGCTDIITDWWIQLEHHVTCDPLETVYVVTIAHSAPAGGGASILGSGGSVVASNNRYEIVEYKIGPRTTHNYWAKLRHIETVCTDSSGQVTSTHAYRVLTEFWTVGSDENAICSRRVVTGVFDKFSDAQSAANVQAGNDPSRRKHDGAGLADRE